MYDLYTVFQDDTSKWWGVKGPSTRPDDSLWRTSEEAKRVAYLLARAYAKGQASVLGLKR